VRLDRGPAQGIVWMLVLYAAVIALVATFFYSCSQEVWAADELPCASGKQAQWLLRWKAPASGGAVTHYRVYRAASHEGYVEDQFTEFAMQSTPGAILSAEVPGWDPLAPTFVVMTAFGPDGESDSHSNELVVPAIERICNRPGRPTLGAITVTTPDGRVITISGEQLLELLPQP